MGKPSPAATSVELTFMSPSGSLVSGNVTVSGGNAATVIVFARIDTPGTWRVQVTNPGGLTSSTTRAATSS
jgi:hypothetical protein